MSKVFTVLIYVADIKAEHASCISCTFCKHNYADVHAYMHIHHVCAYVHTHACIQHTPYAHIHVHTHKQITQAYTHPHTHKHTHAHTLKHMHIHMHTHT